jgi:hypothetical protein
VALLRSLDAYGRRFEIPTESAVLGDFHKWIGTFGHPVTEIDYKEWKEKMGPEFRIFPLLEFMEDWSLFEKSHLNMEQKFLWKSLERHVSSKIWAEIPDISKTQYINEELAGRFCRMLEKFELI